MLLPLLLLLGARIPNLVAVHLEQLGVHAPVGPLAGPVGLPPTLLLAPLLGRVVGSPRRTADHGCPVLLIVVVLLLHRRGCLQMWNERSDTLGSYQTRLAAVSPTFIIVIVIVIVIAVVVVVGRAQGEIGKQVQLPRRVDALGTFLQRCVSPSMRVGGGGVEGEVG